MGYPAKKIEMKSNFLRKGQGRGGSPTEFDHGMIDEETGKQMVTGASSYSIDSPIRSKITNGLIPVRRDNMTTVRVRTKNNSFIYGEQDMDGSQQMGRTGYAPMDPV